MTSACLYVGVSTDEQKKGYSLPEQEGRLARHCEFNNIEVKGIYREDYYFHRLFLYAGIELCWISLYQVVLF
jgi:hypothetical protein